MLHYFKLKRDYNTKNREYNEMVNEYNMVCDRLKNKNIDVETRGTLKNHRDTLKKDINDINNEMLRTENNINNIIDRYMWVITGILFITGLLVVCFNKFDIFITHYVNGELVNTGTVTGMVFGTVTLITSVVMFLYMTFKDM